MGIGAALKRTLWRQDCWNALIPCQPADKAWFFGAFVVASNSGAASHNQHRAETRHCRTIRIADPQKRWQSFPAPQAQHGNWCAPSTQRIAAGQRQSSSSVPPQSTPHLNRSWPGPRPALQHCCAWSATGPQAPQHADSTTSPPAPAAALSPPHEVAHGLRLHQPQSANTNAQGLRQLEPTHQTPQSISPFRAHHPPGFSATNALAQFHER